MFVCVLASRRELKRKVLRQVGCVTPGVDRDTFRRFRYWSMHRPGPDGKQMPHNPYSPKVVHVSLPSPSAIARPPVPLSGRLVVMGVIFFVENSHTHFCGMVVFGSRHSRTPLWSCSSLESGRPISRRTRMRSGPFRIPSPTPGMTLCFCSARSLFPLYSCGQENPHLYVCVA